MPCDFCLRRADRCECAIYIGAMKHECSFPCAAYAKLLFDLAWYRREEREAGGFVPYTRALKAEVDKARFAKVQAEVALDTAVRYAARRVFLLLGHGYPASAGPEPKGAA